MVPATEPPPVSVASPVTLRRDLEREPGSDDALLRVVSTLHRRRCRVTRAFFSSEGDFADELDLRLEVPVRSATQVTHWLRALIDVRSVTLLS